MNIENSAKLEISNYWGE